MHQAQATVIFIITYWDWRRNHEDEELNKVILVEVAVHIPRHTILQTVFCQFLNLLKYRENFLIDHGYFNNFDHKTLF